MTQLDNLVGRTQCLLLDFDGPMAAMFAGYSAAEVVAEMHAVIVSHLGAVPASLREVASDPIQTLIRTAALDDDDLTSAVAEVCEQAEVKAAQSAVRTPGSVEVVRAAVNVRMHEPLIVTNNFKEAVKQYLGAQHVVGGYSAYLTCIAAVVGRTRELSPTLLKPHPYLVERARQLTGIPADQTLFVGDSTSDVVAGHAAGVAVVGYANKPGKRERLTAVGADVVVDSMHEIADAVSRTKARQAW